MNGVETKSAIPKSALGGGAVPLSSRKRHWKEIWEYSTASAIGRPVLGSRESTLNQAQLMSEFCASLPSEVVRFVRWITVWNGFVLRVQSGKCLFTQA
jgi:hypothetical protein